MRKLLSLRRDEAPIIGEVYRFGDDFLKCVADNGSITEGCEACCFDVRSCYGACEGVSAAFPSRHFELVSESEAEFAADIKFRNLEETKYAPPLLGERFIAAIGLVEYVEKQDCNRGPCVQCDLTQRECDVAVCGINCCYKKVKR